MYVETGILQNIGLKIIVIFAFYNFYENIDLKSVWSFRLLIEEGGLKLFLCAQSCLSLRKGGIQDKLCPLISVLGSISMFQSTKIIKRGVDYYEDFFIKSFNYHIYNNFGV